MEESQVPPDPAMCGGRRLSSLDLDAWRQDLQRLHIRIDQVVQTFISSQTRQLDAVASELSSQRDKIIVKEKNFSELSDSIAGFVEAEAQRLQSLGFDVLSIEDACCEAYDAELPGPPALHRINRLWRKATRAFESTQEAKKLETAAALEEQRLYLEARRAEAESEKERQITLRDQEIEALKEELEVLRADGKQKEGVKAELSDELEAMRSQMRDSQEASTQLASQLSQLEAAQKRLDYEWGAEREELARTRDAAETKSQSLQRSLDEALEKGEELEGNIAMGKDRRKSRSRSRRRNDDEEADDLSPESKLQLLEVENATLKAENRELRKKLVEALRQGGNGARSKPERHKEEVHKEERQGRREEEPVAASDTNAVLLVNAQMEAYNEPIPNNIPPEKRLPLVENKLKRFMAQFDDKVQILDLKSGQTIIKDRNLFIKRYTCVFRESGSKLQGSCLKRFYFDSSGPTYCIDYEMHESLVTAMPGTPPDGKLGVRDPRTEHLIVLYEEKGGKLTRMWLRPDSEKLGSDTYAGEDILAASEAYKQFEAKLKEVTGGKLGERIFHNYHDIPSVG